MGAVVFVSSSSFACVGTRDCEEWYKATLSRVLTSFLTTLPLACSDPTIPSSLHFCLKAFALLFLLPGGLILKPFMQRQFVLSYYESKKCKFL